MFFDNLGLLTFRMYINFGLVVKGLRQKVERERICTYVTTRQPVDNYHEEAMTTLLGSPWIEVRYNRSIHAKEGPEHSGVDRSRPERSSSSKQ